MKVTSPDGRCSIATERLTVRSTAVSGVGFVLSVGAGLFLVGWWIHHLRGERRLNRRKTRPCHPSSAAPAGLSATARYSPPITTVADDREP